MLIGSEHSKHVCKECAEICDQCGNDRERLGGMADRVAACRLCADSTRQMAG